MVRTAALVGALLSLVGYCAAAYDQKFAQTAVMYAEAAFCEGNDLDHWKCGKSCKATPGVTKVTRVSDGNGIFGYTAYNEQTNLIIVAFRGSDNTENWISNINFIMKQYKNVPNAKVHRGFYEAYQSVSSQVISSVKALIEAHPSAKILYTGHSLGAALTTFAAVDVIEQLHPKNEPLIYTLGSPRTGNQAFCDHVMTHYQTGEDKSFYRVVHYNDIVPHLPMTEFGFYHVGDEVWYTQPGLDLTYKICRNQKGQSENPNCADTLCKYDPDSHMQYVGIDLKAGWCGGSALEYFLA